MAWPQRRGCAPPRGVRVYWIERAYVPVDNVALMEAVDRDDDFGRVDFGLGFGEGPVALQMEKELAAVDIVQHQVELSIDPAGHKAAVIRNRATPLRPL